MNFLSAVHSDTGISKKNNQDAFCLKTVKLAHDNVAFAVLCDGMGGLKNGELASAFVVNAFCEWFENSFSIMSQGKIDFEEIKKQWHDIAIDQANKIMNYGKERSISLGTTLNALLIVGGKYIFINVGDTRIYKLNDEIQQLTTDHTVVAHEVKMNRLTYAEAETDSRSHILLQCIGASGSVFPEIIVGETKPEEEFLLCSDGFRHKISSDEIYGVLAPRLLLNEKIIKKCLVDLTELNKTRKETDNITTILIKVIN